MRDTYEKQEPKDRREHLEDVKADKLKGKVPSSKSEARVSPSGRQRTLLEKALQRITALEKRLDEELPALHEKIKKVKDDSDRYKE